MNLSVCLSKGEKFTASLTFLHLTSHQVGSSPTPHARITIRNPLVQASSPGVYGIDSLVDIYHQSWCPLQHVTAYTCKTSSQHSESFNAEYLLSAS